MEQRYANVFTMMSTVRDFMNAHVADTTGVPAIPVVVTTLTGLISQIDALGTSQGTPLTGIASDKEVVRTALEEATFLVSEALGALGAATNNNTLLEEMNLSRPDLDDLSADDLDAFATRVTARAATNQSVLTGTYGITLAQVTAVTTARTAFAPWVNKPRLAVADRAGQTAAIPGLVRQGKILLKQQLDRLMTRYRLTNAALYEGYKTARVVVDRHGAGGTTAALGIASAVGTGSGGVALTYSALGGAGAVSIMLEWKGPGETVFGHGVPVVRAGQTVVNAAFVAGAVVAFRTVCVNAAGHAAVSAVKTVTL